MTDTTLAVPAGMTRHELPATEEVLHFWGYLIDRVDNDSGDRLRWAELRLYKILDSNENHDAELTYGEWQLAFPDEDPDDYGMYGQELWLLYTIGHSLVVHELDTTCRHHGVRSTPAEFRRHNEDYEDLEPCTVCHPDMTDSSFELETTWYSWTRCQTPEKVLLSLRKEASCKHCTHKPHRDRGCWCKCPEYAEGPRPLSVPGERLLRQASGLDPEIAAVFSKRRQL